MEASESVDSFTDYWNTCLDSGLNLQEKMGASDFQLRVSSCAKSILQNSKEVQHGTIQISFLEKQLGNFKDINSKLSLKNAANPEFTALQDLIECSLAILKIKMCCKVLPQLEQNKVVSENCKVIFDVMQRLSLSFDKDLTANKKILKVIKQINRDGELNKTFNSLTSDKIVHVFLKQKLLFSLPPDVLKNPAFHFRTFFIAADVFLNADMNWDLQGFVRQYAEDTLNTARDGSYILRTSTKEPEFNDDGSVKYLPISLTIKHIQDYSVHKKGGVSPILLWFDMTEKSWSTGPKPDPSNSHPCLTSFISKSLPEYFPLVEMNPVNAEAQIRRKYVNMGAFRK